MMNLPDHDKPSEHVYDYGFDPDNMPRIIDGTSFSYGVDDMALPFSSIINHENALESRSTMRNQWPGVRPHIEQSRRDYTAELDHSQVTGVVHTPAWRHNRGRRP